MITDNEVGAIAYAAMMAHEANRLWCEANGDYSQPVWDEAPGWQQESATNGVFGVLSGNTPRESHESWLKHKREHGWVYGETKDATTKTHPCLVEYDDLSDDDKFKDELFTRFVRASVATARREDA